ncbi:glycosyltransferase [Aurantibacter sp.]|uniref:glycosyltransferase n=1 Tax=Aurantibacter sp. TaxID=2807103 RepID=UPI003265588A
MEIGVNRSKLKVVYVITGLRTGGAEMMLYKLLTRIDRNRFSPTVITMISGGKFEELIKELNIDVYSLGMKRGIPNPRSVIRLINLFKLIKPDVVQGWMYHGNFIAQLGGAFSLLKVPVIWSIHHSVDALKNEKFSLAVTIKLTAFLSKNIKRVVFSANKGMLQHINIGYSGENAITINDNFDINKFSPVIDLNFDLRKNLNLPVDSILIGSVARFHPMKDHANLIKAAFETVKDCEEEVHFILVGPNVDERNLVLTNQIKELGLSERVHLLGERNNITEILTSLDIFTSSSSFGESFPNVIGEAMSCETPCVVTDVGDSKFLVGNIGEVILPDDYEALAFAWKKLIKIGDVERRKLGKESRNRIVSLFNVDGPNSFVKKYENIYKEAHNLSVSA